MGRFHITPRDNKPEHRSWRCQDLTVTETCVGSQRWGYGEWTEVPVQGLRGECDVPSTKLRKGPRECPACLAGHDAAYFAAAGATATDVSEDGESEDDESEDEQEE